MFVLKGCYIFFSVLLEKSYQSKIFFTVLSSLMRLFQVSQCNNQTSQKCLCSFVWGGLKKCPGFSFFFVKVAQVSWASLNFWHASLMRQPVIVGCSGKNVNRISNSLWEEINAKEDFFIWSETSCILRLINSFLQKDTNVGTKSYLLSSFFGIWKISCIRSDMYSDHLDSD